MLVLCIDLSVNAPGFAIGDSSTGKVLDFGSLKNSSSEPLYFRFKKNLKFFSELVSKKQIKAVWLEMPAFGLRQNSHAVLLEQQGIFKFYFYSKNIPVCGLNISEIKKFVTGNGKAKKTEMIAAIKKQGFAVANDNEADAISIFFTGIAKKSLLQIN